MNNIRRNNYILKGHSGIGKSEFINYLISYFSKQMLDDNINVIPVKLELKYWTENTEIVEKIIKKINIPRIKKEDLNMV